MDNNLPKDKNTLNSFQWNCHGLLNKKDSITQILNDYDILALSETWLSSEKDFALKDFHIFRQDGPSRKSGGVLLAVRDWISYKKVDNIFTPFPGILEATGVEIVTHSQPLYIITVYRHPTQPVPLLWENLLNSIPSSSRILITGDFNAHHTSWGCHRSDGISKSLFSTTQDFSLFSINDGSPTFISRPSQAPSVIDLTFVSANLSPFCSWNLFNDSLNSDHIPTIISINHPVNSGSFFSHKLSTAGINWNHFYFSLHSQLPHLASQINNDSISELDKYEIFLSTVKNTVSNL